MDVTVVVFALVYLAMLLGGVPGLALDRTGAALLGAIVLVATETIPPERAWHAVDVPTLCLLFGLMVVSAQFRLAGFYSHVTRGLAAADVTPPALLALLILIVAEQAAPLGVRLGWREHARVGVPVTLLTLGIAALWLALRAFW